jgi:hypothetical protein
MKTILLSAAVILAGSLCAAHADPKDDITGAAQKLAGEANYSWHTTVVVPSSSRFKPGPTDGKIEKGGLTDVKLAMRDNHLEVILSGTNAVLTDPDDGTWETLADFESDAQGPARYMGGMVRNFKAPAAQAIDLLADTKNLTQTDGVYSGDLTADGAKKLLSFRRGGNSTVSNPSGSAKFWVTNGELTKFEYDVKGTVTFNDNDMTIDRDTTVEITGIGTTKIDVPDGAKKLLP